MTTKNTSSSSRLTVKSASIPPRSLSQVVYTEVPGATSTFAEEILLRIFAASGPCTKIFANEVWSNSAAPSRQA